MYWDTPRIREIKGVKAIRGADIDRLTVCIQHVLDDVNAYGCAEMLLTPSR